MEARRGPGARLCRGMCACEPHCNGPRNERTRRRCSSPKINIRSKHSLRTVPIRRSCPCSKCPQGRERLLILTSRPYRRGHGDDSLCRCIDLRFPFPQSRRARIQACRPSISIGRSAPTTPGSTSAFIPGSPSMGVALPDLPSGRRRDGAGQARTPWSSGIARASSCIGAGHLVVRDGRRSAQTSVTWSEANTLRGAALCVPRTSAGLLKVRPGNIGDGRRQERVEM
jgi:hypothetical protein